jgi:hypothetical protein
MERTIPDVKDECKRRCRAFLSCQKGTCEKQRGSMECIENRSVRSGARGGSKRTKWWEFKHLSEKSWLLDGEGAATRDESSWPSWSILRLFRR